MARNKPAALPDYGFNSEALGTRQVNSNVRIAVDRDAKRKVARRDFSVFDQLATNGKTVGDVIYPPTLTKPESVAGNDMFAVYMVWKGLAGAPDREDAGFVDQSRQDRELVTDRMVKAGEYWNRILYGKIREDGKWIKRFKCMEPKNARLLNALCYDMSIADGAMLDTKADRPIVRWRHVVKTALNISDRDCQRDAVKRMCKDVVRWI